MCSHRALKLDDGVVGEVVALRCHGRSTRAPVPKPECLRNPELWQRTGNGLAVDQRNDLVV